jgi:tRNA (guanosine-2'-O-)-methyltransferase
VTPRQLGPTEVKRLNRSWRRATHDRLCLLLESVSHPFNLGSIVRTAATFGVERVWLCGDCADPGHPAARKTALGTGRFLAFDRAPSLPDAVAAVRQAGLRLVAVELAAGAVPVHRAAIGGDVCLALGNEDRGCSAGLLAAADEIAYIPQAGRVGSLSVAAAAAIVLAEARRREWANAGPDAGASVDNDTTGDEPRGQLGQSGQPDQQLRG